MQFIHINGIGIRAKALITAMPEGDGVHITLENGATYLVPLADGETPDSLALRIVRAAESNAEAPVETRQAQFEQSIDEGPWGPGLPAPIAAAVAESAAYDETTRDARDNKFFSDGWRAHHNETKLQKANGTLDLFLEEQDRYDPQTEPDYNTFGKVQEPDYDPVVVMGFADPDQPFPELGEPTKPDYDEAVANIEIHTNGVARKAESSGEPEEEMNQTRPVDSVVGDVTLSYEEWQDGLEEAYERGRKDGLVPNAGERQITERTLAKMVQEEIVQAGGQAPNNLTMVKAILPRLGFTVVEA